MSSVGGYITLKEATKRFGLTERRWQQLCKNGEIAAIRFGRIWIVQPSVCADYLKRI